MKKIASRCPECGAALAPDAPLGFCPQCLMKAGMNSQGQSMDSSETLPLSPQAGADPVGATDPASSSDAQPGFVGSSVGKYRLISLLSEGGQAYVFRAVHPTLQHELIVKLGKHSVPEGEPEQAGLVAEGKVLAELDHPHMARVYDLGVHENRPYLVMEYVRGRNLWQRVEAQRLTPREAVELVAKVSRALHVAHVRGVVHKDIKPENIVIDQSGEPRLIDFGLAKLQDAWTRGAEEPGAIGGTIAYIAPEQARGETNRVDQRSDIFALGAVLYWLLVGEAPFWDEAWQKAFDRARACDFDREALRRLGISRRLETICLKAMAADREDRYATADELADALEGFARRSRRWLLTAAAGALVLLAVALGIWWRGDQPTPTGSLSIESMKFAHYRGKEANYLGDVGSESYSTRFDDDIRVQVKLSRPAYCYLIAFNTDGTVQLCYPETESTPPQRIEVLDYPSGKYFGLTDGAGVQALVLVASIEPLSPYERWRTRTGKPPWKHIEHDEIEQGVVWRFADAMSGLVVKARGEVRERSKAPKAFEDLCNFFTSCSFDAIHALAFLVKPKDAL